MWQALEALSSIGGKGGVQKRMKGNSQWISKSASCRDVWTAWLSHSQLSFLDKTFSTVVVHKCHGFMAICCTCFIYPWNQLLFTMTMCCNVLDYKTKLENGLFWNQKHNQVMQVNAISCICMCITQNICKMYFCIGKKTYNTDKHLKHMWTTLKTQMFTNPY